MPPSLCCGADRHEMSPNYTDPHSCCPTALSGLKVYEVFIFVAPIILTLVLLFLFYWFHLRGRRIDRLSLRMQRSLQPNNDNYVADTELGLKKELREMLPIIVYKETFCIKDTQCSVCLGDYEAEDRLQQIPSCGHTFHMGCIDHWLSTRTTCPLCRLSIIPSDNDSAGSPEIQAEANHSSSNLSDGTAVVFVCPASEDAQTSEHLSVSGNREERELCDNAKKGESSSQSNDNEAEVAVGFP